MRFELLCFCQPHTTVERCCINYLLDVANDICNAKFLRPCVRALLVGDELLVEVWRQVIPRAACALLLYFSSYHMSTHSLTHSLNTCQHIILFLLNHTVSILNHVELKLRMNLWVIFEVAIFYVVWMSHSCILWLMYLTFAFDDCYWSQDMQFQATCLSRTCSGLTDDPKFENS